MKSKRIKSIIIFIVIVVSIYLMGYPLRIDRFGISQISWVDCLKINGNMYYSDFERTPVDESLVLQQIGIIKFNVSENVNNPSYRFRNGDATHLKVGTKIYNYIESELNPSVIVKVGEAYYIYRFRD